MSNTETTMSSTPVIPTPSTRRTGFQGTCACCFRTQKVVYGYDGGHYIAKHGYRRPGDGHLTAPCMGAQYAPFERSKFGTEAMLESVERVLAGVNDSIAHYESGAATQVPARARPWSRETTVQSREELGPKWVAAVTVHLVAIRNTAYHLERHRADLVKRLTGWSEQSLRPAKKRS